MAAADLRASLAPYGVDGKFIEIAEMVALVVELEEETVMEMEQELVLDLVQDLAVAPEAEAVVE